jgi:hypothetical protein
MRLCVSQSNQYTKTHVKCKLSIITECAVTSLALSSVQSISNINPGRVRTRDYNTGAVTHQTWRILWGVFVNLHMNIIIYHQHNPYKTQNSICYSWSIEFLTQQLLKYINIPLTTTTSTDFIVKRKEKSAHVTFICQLETSGIQNPSNGFKFWEGLIRNGTDVVKHRRQRVRSDTHDSLTNYTTKHPVTALITSLRLAYFCAKLQKQASLYVLIKTVSNVLPKHMFRCRNVEF